MPPNLICQDKTDEDLVSLTLKNNDYFSCLMSRYEQRLLFYIIRLSGFKKDEAEDVLQETFIKTFYHLSDFDKKLKFSSWLYRITHNETINALKKKKSKIIINLTTEDWQNIATKNNLKEEIAAKINQEKIKQLINHLEPKYQEVIILKFLEDYSYEEISDILQKPTGTIATLLNRAKKKLKQEFIKINFTY
ncbi:MAG TPA: RNA polymerase sigma factor [bacterium]|nr:RNA polymerase sigma factor [bacterium]HPL95377.1 RNA polymerase sigma factor [bacterium]